MCVCGWVYQRFYPYTDATKGVRVSVYGRSVFAHSCLYYCIALEKPIVSYHHIIPQTRHTSRVMTIRWKALVEESSLPAPSSSEMPLWN